jgi:outer membrane lipoprotein SlyB
MKAFIGCTAALIVLVTATGADAKGCLKGAAVGGVAGHYSGHHGLLGAAAGCVIGRHEANKRDRMQRNQIDRPDRDRQNREERP